MENSAPPPAPRTVWAYAYQIVPPQTEKRLQPLKTLLDRERTDAHASERTWDGRFVVERQVTHILIVSDSPDLDLEANRRMEAELRRLKAVFAVTAPLRATAEPAASEVPGTAPATGAKGARP